MDPKVISPKKIKFFEQRQSGMCGPAALRSLLYCHGVKKSEDELARLCHSSPKYGTTPEMMEAALAKLGFRTKTACWQSKEESWNALNHWINEMGLPVLVDWFSKVDGHYSVVWKLTQQHIWIADPEFHLKKDRARKMAWNDFFRAWFDFYGDYLTRKSDLFARWWLVAFRAPLSRMK